MTKEEFEESYARRSGMTIEFLHELGLQAIFCDCGLESCHGWQMAGPEPVIGAYIPVEGEYNES